MPSIFTVTLSRPSPQTITVGYTTQNGSASAPGDYSTITGTITFLPGETIAVITVPTLVDSVYDPNETFTVSLYDAVNASISGRAAVGSLLDSRIDLSVTTSVDDPEPEVGGIITVTTVLANAPGMVRASDVQVRSLLGTGFSYVRNSVSQGSYDPATGVWTVGSMDGGETVTLTLKARVLGHNGLSNLVEVTAAGQPDVDSAPGNAGIAREDDDSEVSVSVLEGPDASSCSGRVIISEIAWAGTEADPEGQWIELQNLGAEDVNLRGWTLRWRKKVPLTEEDYLWKVVQLSGVLRGSGTSACDLAKRDPVSDIEFAKRSTDDPFWLVTARTREDDGSYLLLERKTDDTIRDIGADIVYDSADPYHLALNAEGDTVQLRNRLGHIVDTANDFEPYGIGDWPAGDAEHFATMERTDPLRPDVADNWHTNVGIVAKGEDTVGRPLAATARGRNSRSLAEWTDFAEASTVRRVLAAGTQFDVELDFAKPTLDGAQWPWLRVSQRAPADGGGGGGASPYTLSGGYISDTYALSIDTVDGASGDHFFWIIEREREAVLAPITIRP
jgi:uncharacterized repeat protein (TIGR01451 family)